MREKLFNDHAKREFLRKEIRTDWKDCVAFTLLLGLLILAIMIF